MLIETHALTKRYGKVAALEHCTLRVRPGEVYGLLGPNGAGKTTLLRLLLGFLTPTSGTATIDGLDCHRQSLRVRRLVSYLPGEVRLFRQMRGRKVLKFFAELRPEGNYVRSLALASRLELNLTRRVSAMSTGMRQKLGIAATMAADTPLLILDEPTTNLDPTIRGVVLELVNEARELGRTVLFSSHVLSEVEQACDRVGFLQGGRLVRTQVMSELKARHRIRAVLAGPMPSAPASLDGELSIRSDEDGHVIIETPGELSPLLSWLSTLPLRRMNVEPIGLRSLYDQLHGEPSEEAEIADE